MNSSATVFTTEDTEQAPSPGKVSEEMWKTKVTRNEVLDLNDKLRGNRSRWQTLECLKEAQM